MADNYQEQTMKMVLKGQPKVLDLDEREANVTSALVEILVVSAG